MALILASHPPLVDAATTEVRTGPEGGRRAEPDGYLETSLISEAEKAAAGELLNRAKDLTQQGRLDAAATLLTQAAARYPTARTLGELGLTEVSLRRWSDAERDLYAALQAAPTDWQRENRTNLEKALASARAVLPPPTVTAAPPGNHHVEAQRLLREGMDLRMKNRNEDAVSVFAQAYEMEPSPQAAGQLGLAELATRRFVEAEAHLSQANASPSDSWVHQYGGALTYSLALARTQVGRLLIVGKPVGALIFVNGRQTGELPLPSAIRVAAGQTTIQVTAPGHQPYVSQTTIEPSKETRIEVALARRGPDDAPAGSTDPRRWSGWAWAGLAATIAGGALAAIGTWSLTRAAPAECSSGMQLVCPGRSTAPGIALVTGGALMGGVGAWAMYSQRSHSLPQALSFGWSGSF